jgi:hypothetical protein
VSGLCLAAALSRMPVRRVQQVRETELKEIQQVFEARASFCASCPDFLNKIRIMERRSKMRIAMACLSPTVAGDSIYIYIQVV